MACVKRAILLCSLNEECYILLRNLCTPVLPETKSYEQLLGILTDFFFPSKSLFNERLKFYIANFYIFKVLVKCTVYESENKMQAQNNSEKHGQKIVNNFKILMTKEILTTNADAAASEAVGVDHHVVEAATIGVQNNNPGYQKPTSVQVAPSMPKPTPGATIKPKNLATEATAPKNDPMWLAFEDHGFVGLTPYRGENTFATTFEGLMPLIDREYDLIGSADRTFTKFVSRAMWTYYCVQHVYTRIIAIKTHRGESTYREMTFMNSLRSDNFPMPPCLEEYLRSVGCTTDASGKKYTIRFPA